MPNQRLRPLLIGPSGHGLTTKTDRDQEAALALHYDYAIDMRALDTLTRRRERIAGIHGLSIDTIELYERNMIDELPPKLAHGELPVGS